MASIQAAFDRWIQYIENRHVYEAGFEIDAEEDTPRTALLRFASHLQLTSSCAGTEDLTFYFGSGTKETETIRNKYIDPVSFAYQQKFNAKRGWSRVSFG